MYAKISALARGLAVLGGAVLAALIVLICLSVLGRGLNGALHSDIAQSVAPGGASALLGLGIGPINGDYEIVEAGMAFAIFAFLPICQLHGAHASVNIFTARLPERPSRVLQLVTEAIFAAVLVVIAWQLILGGLSKYRSGQTTFLLEFPVWWSYAASIFAMTCAALVGLYVAGVRAVEVWRGQAILPVSGEGAH